MVPLNLPNLLTVVRILLVPVVVVALLAETPNADMLAAIVFAVAAFTDGLDGYIARSRGSVTTFGKLMDPLADKLLIIAALVSLVSLGRIAGLGRDGDHRARVRGHGAADARGRAGRGDPGEHAREAQDDHAGRGDLRGDRGLVDAAAGSTCSSTRGRGHGRLGRGLLLRAAPPDRGRAARATRRLEAQRA